MSEDSGIPRRNATWRGQLTHVDCSKERSAFILRAGTTKSFRQKRYFLRRSRGLLNYPLRGVTSQKMTIIIIIIIIIIITTTTSAVHSSNFDCMSLLNHLCSPTPIPRFLSTRNYHRRPLGSYALQSHMQCA